MNIHHTSLKLSITLLAASLSMTMLSCGDDDGDKIKEPVITNFAPASALPGASVTISGNNFSPTPASDHVSFNGAEAVVTSATATQLIVTIPESATTGKITVTVNGKTATSAANFTILETAITGFSPESGRSGAAVTITGTNFGTTPSENVVKFNGVAATVTSATATELVATVPETATTGKITVTLNGKTATSSTDFTVLQATIAGFSPESGAQGTEVTITGTNFSTTPSENVVKFNDVAATVTSATATELVVTVPETATTGKITVTVGNQTATSSADFTVLQTTITEFSPESGAHGTEVTITGTGFSTTLGDNAVKFNGVDATVSAATPTQLTVSVPAEATTGKITVNVDGRLATSATDFAVPAPVITSYFPAIAAVGISVAITGTNFSPVAANNTVKFNGVDATVTAASATELTVTVPAGATAGAITVDVGLATATSADEFEICSSSAELVISDVVISNDSGASSYAVSFKVTNVGAADADLTKMVMQNYASTDAVNEGNDLAAGGTFLPSASTIAPGQSYDMATFTASMGGGNTASYPYLIIMLYDSPDGSVAECNIDNNIVIKHFN
jgi:hypothetical protein